MNKSIGFIIHHTETILPQTDIGSSSSEERDLLVFLIRWAQDPLFLAADLTIILLTNQLSSIHSSLVQDPRILSISIPHPDYKQRLYYLKQHLIVQQKEENITPEAIARHSSGLNLLNIRGMLSYASENKKTLTVDYISYFKKERIES